MHGFACRYIWNWWDGFIMDFDLLDQLVEIPNVNSIKWSHEDIQLFKQGLERYSKKVSMIDNSGNHILSNIYGATGFITTFLHPRICSFS